MPFFKKIHSSLETLQQNRRHSMFFQSVNLGEVVMCLEDLINYFAQPEDDMGSYKIFLNAQYYEIASTN